MNLDNLKLKPDQLTKTYSSKDLKKISKGNNHFKTLIGQQRAKRALEFGLGNKTDGFNVFVSGVPGLGKQSAVVAFLEKIASKESLPNDWCYVNNFDNFYSPNYLRLEKGQGRVFQKEIKKFLIEVRLELGRVMGSKDYQDKKEAILKKLYKGEIELLAPIKKRATENKFIIEQFERKINAVPELDGRAMKTEEFLALGQDEKDRILAKTEEFKMELNIAAKKMEEMHLDFREEQDRLEKTYGKNAIELILKKLQKKYKSNADLLIYLSELQVDILENLAEFLSVSKNLSTAEQNLFVEREEMLHSRYDVNVIVDHSNSNRAPIVLEQNPTYPNLFGKIEKESLNGALITNFTLIRGGALHNANGGYLLVPVEEILKNYFSWKSLIRALKSKEILIEEPADQFGFLSTKSIKPQAIPLDIQVILFGDPYYYQILLRHDNDFKRLFKVIADFDTSMESNSQNVSDYLIQIERIAERENLLPLTEKGKLRLLTLGHRLASNQSRLSIRLEEIMDVFREAHHYAKSTTCKCIDDVLIDKAIEEKKMRTNLYQEKIQELVSNKEILIDLSGKKVGQINGLAVVGSNDSYFGRPNCITAAIGLGKGGIIDVEREVNLGGPIHSKGVLILKGFLTELFGEDKTLNLSAQLAFEQSYSEIEGDSASSTELYAILSALSKVPLNQGIAVTGSVNQKGRIQAVGGINEKIEGYFDICSNESLTGTQGVIIPRSNVKHLVLNKEIIKAVSKNLFHIWAIEDVREGIEILTGMKAGEKFYLSHGNNISFERGSVFQLANERLLSYSKKEIGVRKKQKNYLGRIYHRNGQRHS